MIGKIVNVRVIKNRHKKADKALRAWSGHLWGHPMDLGLGKIHIYGCNTKSCTTLAIEFTDSHIVVMRRKGQLCTQSSPASSGSPTRTS